MTAPLLRILHLSKVGLLNRHVDLHGGTIFLTIGMRVDNGLTHGVGLSTSKTTGILTYVAAVLVWVELCKDTSIAVITAHITCAGVPVAKAGRRTSGGGGTI